ncbi:MAG: fructose,6-bisphosphate aldolase [Microvirga sp.]|nr:fructose,6-bisphosphate aldolase [Microvirga sp.]
MARITMRQLLDHAAEQGYGVPAFNINNMEQALAIMAAASEVDAPVIIQASRGARSYANDVMLKHMMDAVTEIYPQIPVCVHLDHGNEPATCMTAIQAGFTSVMMDGSLKADGKTPGDWDYNVGVTKKVVEMAHLGGISVEGELGVPSPWAPRTAPTSSPASPTARSSRCTSSRRSTRSCRTPIW